MNRQNELLKELLTYTSPSKIYIIITIISVPITIICSFLMISNKIPRLDPFEQETDIYKKVSMIQNITEKIAVFSFYNGFLNLALPDCFIFISGIPIMLINFIPGGYTIINLILKHFNIITLPTWALILGILVDIWEFKLLVIPFIKYLNLKRKLRKKGR